MAPNNIKEIYALLTFIAGCIFRKDNKNTQSQCRLRVKRRLDPISHSEYKHTVKYLKMIDAKKRKQFLNFSLEQKEKP